MVNIINRLIFSFRNLGDTLKSRSECYDCWESLEFNPDTGEVHFKPKWYKFVYMITFIYRSFKAYITWNWNYSEDWMFKNKNKKGFVDYYLYDEYYKHYDKETAEELIRKSKEQSKSK